MKKFNCAVCGGVVVPDDFGLCSICNWEYDPVQEADPNYRGGANKRSLNEAKTAWSARNVAGDGNDNCVAIAV